MGTTAREGSTSRARGPRSDRASRRAAASGEQREEQYDLLTAALIGVVIGAGATMLFRRGPRGSRPIVPLLRAAGKGARMAGMAGMAGAHWAAPHVGRGARWAGRHAADGAGWVADRGEDLWDRVPVEDIQEQVGDYLNSARDAIANTVESELQDLRKAIRRQRKKLGV